ncbi:CopM family metallochaperone [Devosia sp.]|uniref:CopM family metallochaperone n=1 Tax=Devosia sp. TaxID=1871048 RepID=UPI003F710539
MTKTLAAFSTALLALVVAASGATAQDAMAGHDMSAMGGSAETTLPEICQTDAGKQAAAAMPSMPMGHTMDVGEGNMALMAGMDQMHKDMMAGTMASDVDVAFVCGMIPHHQGAISMAKAELKYGDNDWAKAMAQKVIDAQEQEIADMIAWLAEQPK